MVRPGERTSGGLQAIHIRLRQTQGTEEASQSEGAISRELSIRPLERKVEETETDPCGAHRRCGMRLDNFLTLPGARPVLSWEPGAGKSYSIPAVEIIGFDFLLNQFDRHFIDADEYGSNFSTFRHNLTHKWVVDNDPFATNQFLHPYQGSMYHGFARSAGLNYWESLGYAFAGSVLWETAGETTPPSINDQIASGIGGTFLGRATLPDGKPAVGERRPGPAVLARAPSGGDGRCPRASTALCSATGLMPCLCRHPTFNWRLQLGGSWTAHNGLGASQSARRSEAIADLALAYGLPGEARL